MTELKKITVKIPAQLKKEFSILKAKRDMGNDELATVIIEDYIKREKESDENYKNYVES